MNNAIKRRHTLIRYARQCVTAAVCFSPLAAMATDYPLTVQDMDHQTVVISHEPKRIILQDGRDIMALALLDRADPFARVISWNNLIKKQDGDRKSVVRERV